MNQPTELILRDVRCFEGEQRGRLRPVTLLVGENSTGKTTFLACYSVLHRVFSGFWPADRLDFNKEPFLMGSFRDIVRNRRGPGGRIDEFKLGLTLPPPGADGRPYALVATFSEEGSQPVVSSLRWQFDAEAFLELRRDEGGDMIVATPKHESWIDFPLAYAMFMTNSNLRAEGWRQLLHGIPNGEVIVEYVAKFLPHGNARGRGWLGLPEMPELIPLAPLRSKPKRTYDPIRETATPEGEHVPMLMMRLDRTDEARWNELRAALTAFGRGSGLFSDIEVKRHGRQLSDPFQLQVKVRSGSPANIMDVGYGVSQSLPILVDVLAAEHGRRSDRRPARTAGRLFLLQQPEVHLHPKGQAELANLFIESSRRGNRFLIETHSDHIVDRVRISVRKQALRPDDVSILYFEPSENAVDIHSMTLDEHGNLTGAPDGYRDFFRHETDRLLGFAD